MKNTITLAVFLLSSISGVACSVSYLAPLEQEEGDIDEDLLPTPDDTGDQSFDSDDQGSSDDDSNGGDSSGEDGSSGDDDPGDDGCDLACDVGEEVATCEGDTLMTPVASLDEDECACSVEYSATECEFGCEEGACLDEPPPLACVTDRDCRSLSSSSCTSSAVLANNMGVCRDDVCTVEANTSLCRYGCEEGAGGAACAPNAQCGDMTCPADDDVSSCGFDEDGLEVFTSSRNTLEDQQLCRCEMIEEEVTCATDETCDPEQGCVAGSGCEPCGVLRPGPPVCEDNELVQLTEIRLNPETCECELIFDRRDCAAEGKVCEDGECKFGVVEPDDPIPFDPQPY